MTTRLYIAKLVFKINGLNQQVFQFDEQWRILVAPNAKIALDMAQSAGEKENEEFTSALGKNIQWLFMGVTDLREITELYSIPLVLSKTIITKDYKGTEVTIHRKKEDLLSSINLN